MIYRADGMVLSSVRDVFRGSKNDIVVCQDLASPLRPFYTLLVVKSSDAAKQILGVFERSEREHAEGGEPYLLCFSQDERLCFVFPYRAERKLHAFVEGQMSSVQVRERICINLVMECLASPLPYPLLYLALVQDHIHIEKDNAVFFTPYFDLAELDDTCGEKACTGVCVHIILELLQHGARKPLKSYELLRKKIERNAYQSFPELYRDIKLTAVPEKKTRLRDRIGAWWKRNRDRIFRVLLVLSVTVTVFTLIFFISQLIFGDVPFFRIFEHMFDVIGTETLK